MPLETEVKLRLKGSQQDLVKLLEQLGYAAGRRTLEVDQVYDRASGKLRASGRLLRLRSKGRDWIVTYKGPANTDRHKSREEIETHLADGPAFAQILTGLGYLPAFRYEKQRTTFRAEGAAGIVTLDETPMGDFLELEGEPFWIDHTAQLLGYTAEHYITASYAALYQEYRLLNPAVPEDMTF
jgi:adenylate cyclase, class 2